MPLPLSLVLRLQSALDMLLATVREQLGIVVPESLNNQALLSAGLLYREGRPIRVGEFHARCHRGSNPGYILDVLEKYGYAQRRKTNSRHSVVHLTEEGKRFGAAVSACLDEIEKQIGQHFDDTAFGAVKGFCDQFKVMIPPLKLLPPDHPHLHLVSEER